MQSPQAGPQPNMIRQPSPFPDKALAAAKEAHVCGFPALVRARAPISGLRANARLLRPLSTPYLDPKSSPHRSADRAPRGRSKPLSEPYPNRIQTLSRPHQRPIDRMLMGFDGVVMGF